jgi:hypothetical protein
MPADVVSSLTYFVPYSISGPLLTSIILYSLNYDGLGLLVYSFSYLLRFRHFERVIWHFCPGVFTCDFFTFHFSIFEEVQGSSHVSFGMGGLGFDLFNIWHEADIMNNDRPYIVRNFD